MERKELTRAQRWAIADQLAADRLPEINASLPEVVPSSTFYANYGKRAFDLVISGVAIVVTLPVNVVLGVAAFIDVGKPLLFQQQRVGKNEKLFTISKFRSMRNTVDSSGELLPASQRVTKFGRFIRKTSLDELLNFWNIFKGDMSVIGPRPLVPEYTHRLNKRHRMRLAVRPGLECPPRELSDHAWTWQEQFDNDVWYVESLSFKTDCIMLKNLVKFALDGRNSTSRALSARGIFMGYNSDGIAITLDEVPMEYIDSIAGIGEQVES